MAPRNDRILFVDFQPRAKAPGMVRPKLRIVAPAENQGLTPKRNRFANPGQNPALTHALQNFRRRMTECEQALAGAQASVEALQARHRAIKAEMKASSHRRPAVVSVRGSTAQVMRPVSGKQGGRKSWEKLGSVRDAIRAAKAEKLRLTKTKFDLLKDIHFLEQQRELQFQQYIDSLVSAQAASAEAQGGAMGAEGGAEGDGELSEASENKKAIV
ncbi:MAG: hypothetical protein ACREJ2_18305 [Planctomycetota bacterium]